MTSYEDQGSGYDPGAAGHELQGRAREPVEREWTDQFGTHWEIQAVGPDGRIHTAKITKRPYLGWPDRERLSGEVRGAACGRVAP